MTAAMKNQEINNFALLFLNDNILRDCLIRGSNIVLLLRNGKKVANCHQICLLSRVWFSNVKLIKCEALWWRLNKFGVA